MKFKPSLPQASVIVALAALLVAVIAALPTLNESGPEPAPPSPEVVLKVTKQGGLPATEVIVRGPDGAERKGNYRGIFYLPRAWVGKEVIIEDEATGQTILTITLGQVGDGVREVKVP